MVSFRKWLERKERMDEKKAKVLWGLAKGTLFLLLFIDFGFGGVSTRGRSELGRGSRGLRTGGGLFHG